jgi:propanol-preferring alcohol dehydrogenase
MVLAAPGPATGDGPLEPVDRPTPEPGPGEVRLAVARCAVCRTDLQIAEGDLTPRRSSIVPGHQIVGRIDALGPGVDAVMHPVGSRVGVAWIASTCGVCRFCTTARENLCTDLGFTGWDHDGGYATHVVARADFTYPLPEGFTDDQAAPLLCGGTIGYRSLHVAGVDLDRAAGQRLGLYGFGASATCVIQLAVAAGCEVHVATRSEGERQRALELGAASVGGYDDAPPSPLDAAITFAPAGSVVVAALAALDRGATLAINAIHLDHIPEMDYDQLWWERSVRSVANVTRADVTGFLARAAAVPVTTVFDPLPLDRANEALRRVRAGEVRGAIVLDPT